MHSQLLPYIEQAALFNQLNFSVPPFFPDDNGVPDLEDGPGPNFTVAQVWVDLVPLPVRLQPDAVVALGPGELPVVQRVDVVGPGGRRDVRPVDADRAGERPRRPLEHGRHERAAPRPRRLPERGPDRRTSSGWPRPWTEAAFTEWCASLTDAEAIALPKHYSNATTGLTWLEGNMSWTRYNHVLTPGPKTCVNGVTWNGVAMTAGSRHDGGLGLLLGDGSVRFVKRTVSPAIWRALGTIAGGETLAGDAF